MGRGIPFWVDMAAFAADHGVRRIAFELHPLHLVYNVPTLMRMRDAVGPIIGANVDPSHMFWQQMDPLARDRSARPGGAPRAPQGHPAGPEQVALAGVLDQRPFDDPAHRAWVFRTVGRGHDRAFWAAFVAALRSVGYDDVLSIENEDVGAAAGRGRSRRRPRSCARSWRPDARDGRAGGHGMAPSGAGSRPAGSVTGVRMPLAADA